MVSTQNCSTRSVPEVQQPLLEYGAKQWKKAGVSLMEVYELYDEDYDDYYVYGFFSSEGEAMDWAAKHPGNRYEGINKHTINKPELIERLTVRFAPRS
jgi:hypothetical protein